MATESDKKEKSKSIPLSIDDLSESFCSNCMYCWCANRLKVLYCSLKYKGIVGLLCENNNCKSS
ncbi:MAG: hypothetical protein FK733_09110 [Asgard group archaeon]|nr:hypothetical protein [Asgard group archaeon]